MNTQCLLTHSVAQKIQYIGFFFNFVDAAFQLSYCRFCTHCCPHCSLFPFKPSLIHNPLKPQISALDFILIWQWEWRKCPGLPTNNPNHYSNPGQCYLSAGPVPSHVLGAKWIHLCESWLQSLMALTLVNPLIKVSFFLIKACSFLAKKQQGRG